MKVDSDAVSELRQYSASYPSLKGKTVFITGGGSGIGAVLVRRFSEQGAKVAFVDIQKAASEALVDLLTGQVAHRPHLPPLRHPRHPGTCR